MHGASGNQGGRELAEQFASLCDSADEFPDIFQFLAMHPEAGVQDKAEVCAVDQRLRWKTGRQIPVETYFAELRGVGANPQVKLQLIVGEFHCHQRCGLNPEIEAFASRFPDLIEELRRILNSENEPRSNHGLPPTAKMESGLLAGGDQPDVEFKGELISPEHQRPYPERIGRYRIQRILGDGGFGRVFLAFDEELHRPVAVKLPHPSRISSPEDIETYLDEARIVASLDHPAILPVYDFGRTDDGRCFIVSKYIEGSDLATKIKRVHLTHTAAAELVAIVAEAVHYSHLRGIFHRDLKPSNILIDTENRPYLTDFGIALKEEDVGKDRPTAGTLAYMSPEQLRGEGHLVDGRTDIFSLGIVLYELLSGRRPFGRTRIDRLQPADARPLRQIDESIPHELERICLKALSHRVVERYNTARDMSDDLRHFISGALDASSQAMRVSGLSSSAPRVTSDHLSASNALTIIPKGLRSFDREDAGFYLELLPGPRGRDGLPDSVRFWLTRIQATDSDDSFRVGLVYGPSGCGKSSFLKAGILPNLSGSIVKNYVESTPHETEMRLLNVLRKSCPEIPRDLDLADTLAVLRRGREMRGGTKVLIILDQFEQWLHGRTDVAASELVRALRQCDGVHVQCIVAVRDDFWMAITHFMNELEVALVPDRNISAVDLFNLRHARKVLVAMGRAFGALPPAQQEMDSQQKAFIERSIDELAVNGQVIPVQLALFAEMIKDKPWNLATLKEIGGTRGVGVTFLEDTFNGRAANPQHRLHQKAARAVFSALLSEQAGDIKGAMRSYHELLSCSGYENQQREFDILLRILDSELRLITPTDPSGIDTESGAAASAGRKEERYYHLTHDYLVPAVREWLSLKKKETARGRAELLLSDRARSWQARPSNRTLPSFLEWLRILSLARRQSGDNLQAERQMMRRASRYYLSRIAIAALICTGASWWFFRYSLPRSQSRAWIDSLQTAVSDEVPRIIERLDTVRPWADPLLAEAIDTIEPDSDARLRLSLALLPSDATQKEFLIDRLQTTSPDMLRIISDSLVAYTDDQALADRLWSTLENSDQPGAARLRAAVVLASFQATSPDVDTRWKASASFVVDELVRQIADNQNQFAVWTKAFYPTRNHLIDHLISLYAGAAPEQLSREIAASILAEYVSDRPNVLVDLLLQATPQQHRNLLPKLKLYQAEALPLLTDIYDKPPLPTDQYEKRSTIIRRRAHAAALLFAFGETERVWNSLGRSDDPELGAFLERRLADLNIGAEALHAKLVTTSPVPLRSALLRTLGGIDSTDRGQLPSSFRESCLATFEAAYRDDPDSGVHSAAEWALRSWGKSPAMAPQSAGDKQWFVNSQGQTMIIFNGPVEYRIGSPPDEPGRGERDEPYHPVTINRSFAVSSTEVTREQYMRFIKDFRFAESKRAPDPRCPAISINWVEAVTYCQWLCEQENLPPEEWCYPKDIPLDYGMKLPENFLERSGYRLPTDAEWEYACRAGSTEMYCFGNARELLSDFAWYQENAQNRTWPVATRKPNVRGLFDMHGNVQESCHNFWDETMFTDVGERMPLQEGKLTVTRGGSFTSMADEVRSANRRGDNPKERVSYAIGFRIARTVNR